MPATKLVVLTIAAESPSPMLMSPDMEIVKCVFDFRSQVWRLLISKVDE